MAIIIGGVVWSTGQLVCSDLGLQGVQYSTHLKWAAILGHMTAIRSELARAAATSVRRAKGMLCLEALEPTSTAATEPLIALWGVG